MTDSKTMSTWVVVIHAEPVEYENEEELIETARLYTEAGKRC